MKKEKLGPDILNKAWEAWMAEAYPEKELSSYRPGDNVVWYGGRKVFEQFEFWLFNHGASIRQINYRKYLTFENPALAVMFKLKHG